MMATHPPLQWCSSLEHGRHQSRWQQCRNTECKHEIMISIFRHRHQQSPSPSPSSMIITFMPILSIFLARWIPGVSIGRQIKDLFRCAGIKMWENHGMWQQRKRKETKSRLLTISFSCVCKKTHPVSLVDNFERIFKNMQNVIGLMMIWNLLWMNQPERHRKYGVLMKINLEGIGDPHLLPIDHQVISHSENVGWDSFKRFSNDWNRLQIWWDFRLPTFLQLWLQQPHHFRHLVHSHQDKPPGSKS